MNFENIPNFLVEKNSNRLDRIKDKIYDKEDLTQNEKRVRHHVKFHLLARGLPLDFVNTIYSDHQKFEKKCREFDIVNSEIGGVFDLYDGFLAGYIDNIDDFVYNQGASLVFYGYNETGKTFSALHVLSYALQEGYSGYYINFQDLYKLYNDASYDDDGLSSDFYQYVKNCDFLVVDELGKESNVSEGVIGFLENIIKYRSTEVLPTIFCTNIDFNDKPDNESFLDRYGNSVLNAMTKRYRVIQFSKKGRFRKKTKIDWGQIDES